MNEIIVGIATGIVSSLIVTQLYKVNDDRRERRLSFEHDKQMYSKNIGVIRNELDLYKLTNDTENIKRALEKPQIFASFTNENLSKDSLDIVGEGHQLLENLKEDFKKEDELPELKLDEYKRELFKKQINILRIGLK